VTEPAGDSIRAETKGQCRLRIKRGELAEDSECQKPIVKHREEYRKG
jgi:hypothetical protein